MTRTSRRSRVLLAVGAAALALSSCGIVGNPSNAFSVDGVAYSRSDLNTLVKSLAAMDQLIVVNEVAQSKDLLGILEVVIQYRAAERLLELRGTPVTEAERKAIRDQAAPQMPQSMPARIVDLLVDISATGQALDKIAVPTTDELKKMYEGHPASTGMLCAREITVRTQEEARDVVDQLAGGARFEDLARKVSVAKTAKETGGAVLTGTGEPCMTVPQAGAGTKLGGTLTRALLSTEVGANTGVVQDAKGWHVAVHRPFAEVSTSLTGQLKDKPGRTLADGMLATADIQVNPVYGTWNPVSAKVE